MEDAVDLAELAGGEPAVEVAPVEVVADRGADEIAKLGAVGQVVDRDHVVDADRVEAVHEIGPDHSRSTGDDDPHGWSFLENSSS